MKTKTRFLRYIGYLNSIKTYKAMFNANSSSFTTTDLSTLLTSYRYQKHVAKYWENITKDLVRIYFGLLKILVKF